MISTLIVGKLKAIFVFFVGLFRRVICCFRKRRRLSTDEPLTYVGVVKNQYSNNDLERWEEWKDNEYQIDKKPSTVEEHIQLYRMQQVQQPVEEVQPDFFEDMTPKITKQTKIVLNVNNQQGGRSNNLSLIPNNVHIVSTKLDDILDVIKLFLCIIVCVIQLKVISVQGFQIICQEITLSYDKINF